MKLTKDDKKKLREQYEMVWHKRDGSVDQKMVDYSVGAASGYVMIDGVMVVFDKPHIKRDFWFGEHTWDYDEVVEHCDKCSESEKYFLAENLKDFEWRLENLDDPWEKVYIVPREYCCQSDDCKLGYVEFCRYHEKPRGKNVREMTDGEKEQYAEFIKDEKAKFEKRLNTYLKRYGLSKCSYRVFWADR